MAENEIPQDVIEALADVRDSGETNMFHRSVVIELCAAYGWDEAAEWLDENKSRYMEALNAMGEWITAEGKRKAAPPPPTQEVSPAEIEPVAPDAIPSRFHPDNLTPADYAAVEAMGETAENVFATCPHGEDDPANCPECTPHSEYHDQTAASASDCEYHELTPEQTLKIIVEALDNYALMDYIEGRDVLMDEDDRIGWVLLQTAMCRAREIADDIEAVAEDALAARIAAAAGEGETE